MYVRMKQALEPGPESLAEGLWATPETLAGIPCMYGRWCGPWCSGPAAPIDDVDACCQVHDNCYGRRGYFACTCDRALLRCLAPKRNLRTPKGRAAWTAWSYFKAAPCNLWS